METEITEEIKNAENNKINKLHRIVQETIEENELITNNLLHPPKDILSRGQKISDKVARFGGSWQFIIVFGLVILLWIFSNVFALAGNNFDPYPFILLNLILSCVAAVQAPVIMMSQNRLEEKDRMRGENDYLINLKAEMEIRRLHEKMDLLLDEQLTTLYETQTKQFEMIQEIKINIENLGTK